MNFKYWKFNLSAGQLVTMTVETQCDVYLVDESNLSSLRNGGRFTHYGGAQKMKQVRLVAPHSGTWNVVLMPYPGTSVRYSEPVTFG